MSDDEDLPKLTSSKLKITPTVPTKRATANNNNNQKDVLMANRLATHSKLRAYEAKRRLAYESKLQSSSLYWHAFRTLMHDSLLETQKADILIKGWTYTDCFILRDLIMHFVAVRQSSQYCLFKGDDTDAAFLGSRF